MAFSFIRHSTYMENSFYYFQFERRNKENHWGVNETEWLMWKQMKKKSWKIGENYKQPINLHLTWSIWFTESFTFNILFFPLLVEVILFFILLLARFCLWCSHGKFIFRNMKKIFIFVLFFVFNLKSVFNAKRQPEIKEKIYDKWEKEVNNRENT